MKTLAITLTSYICIVQCGYFKIPASERHGRYVRSSGAELTFLPWSVFPVDKLLPQSLPSFSPSVFPFSDFFNFFLKNDTNPSTGQVSVISDDIDDKVIDGVQSETVQVVQSADISKTVEVVESAEISKTAEVVESAEISKTVEVVESAEISKAVEVVESAGTPKLEGSPVKTDEVVVVGSVLADSVKTGESLEVERTLTAEVVNNAEGVVLEQVEKDTDTEQSEQIVQIPELSGTLGN